MKESRRPPMRGYVRDSRRRKMPLNVDLNDIPPSENRATVSTEDISATQGGAQTSEQGRGGGGGGGGGGGRSAVPPPATIDLEAIDDEEVVISSPRSFAEARSKSRRNQEVVVLGEGVPRICQSNSEEVTTRLTLNGYNTRKRRANPPVINCEQYVILEDRDTKKRNVKRAPVPLPSAPPPKEPTFSCPVCMGPLVEEMSTKCGHIFCTKCIKAAIAAQSKCPTCRRKLTMRDTIRVYLPATDGA